MSAVRLVEPIVDLPDGTLLLTPAEAAKELRVSTSKVYHLISGKEIPFVKIGAAVRIPRTQLRDWINAKVQEEGSA